MEPFLPVFNLEMQRLHYIPDLSCFRILNFPVLISLLVVNSGHADHPTMSPSPMLPVRAQYLPPTKKLRIFKKRPHVSVHSFSYHPLRGLIHQYNAHIFLPALEPGQRISVFHFRHSHFRCNYDHWNLARWHFPRLRDLFPFYHSLRFQYEENHLVKSTFNSCLLLWHKASKLHVNGYCCLNLVKNLPVFRLSKIHF